MKFDLSAPEALPTHVKISFDAMASAIKANDWASAVSLFKAIADASHTPKAKPIVGWMHPTTNLMNADQWAYGPNSRGLVFADETATQLSPSPAD